MLHAPHNPRYFWGEAGGWQTQFLPALKIILQFGQKSNWLQKTATPPRANGQTLLQGASSANLSAQELGDTQLQQSWITGSALKVKLQRGDKTQTLNLPHSHDLWFNCARVVQRCP